MKRSVVVAAAGQAELGEDPGHVLLDGAFGDDHLRGDRGVGAALGHQAQDLALARDEGLQQLVPAAFAGVEGAEVNVTGAAAQSQDFNDQLAKSLPLVFGFVLGFAFLLLLVTFRSVVVPIKAIVLNLLSVGAAYGVLVLVFQQGLGESLLGFHSNGG